MKIIITAKNKREAGTIALKNYGISCMYKKPYRYASKGNNFYEFELRMNIVYEKSNPQIEALKPQIKDIVNLHPTNKIATVAHLGTILPDYKIGWGGSHVWVSNQNNERQIIIYGY